MEFPARYAPPREAWCFCKAEVRGTQHLRTAQMPVNEPFRKRDEVLQKLFSGERVLQNFG
jgi:hypothetical protein